MSLFDTILGFAFGVMATLAAVLVILSRDGYVPQEPSLDPEDDESEEEVDDEQSVRLTEYEQSILADAYDGFYSIHKMYPTCAQFRAMLQDIEFETNS